MPFREQGKTSQVTKGSKPASDLIPTYVSHKKTPIYENDYEVLLDELRARDDLIKDEDIVER